MKFVLFCFYLALHPSFGVLLSGDYLFSTGVAPEFQVLRPGDEYDLFSLLGVYFVR